MTLPIRIQIGAQPTLPQPVTYRGWRCLHNAEGGYMSDPAGMPCVRPSFNAPSIEFTRSMQLLSWDLVKRNPNVTKHRWKVLHGDLTAITNGQGYFNDNDPRRDYVNGEDLDADENPRLMKAIVFAGMFIRGDVGYSVIQAISDAVTLLKTMAAAPRSLIGNFRNSFAALATNNVLRCTPGIHGIDARGPMPMVDEVLEKNWYYALTTGTATTVAHFPQGGGQAVLLPYFLIEPVTYPLAWFEPWERDHLPDTLTFYR